MKRWRAFLRGLPLRPRDALLGVPLIGIAGLMFCTLGGKPYSWSIAWVGISGSAIGLYLLLEWRARRP